ncbi:hypothetical protein ACQ4PT_034701 [Festuca glaucescens]
MEPRTPYARVPVSVAPAESPLCVGEGTEAAVRCSPVDASQPRRPLHHSAWADSSQLGLVFGAAWEQGEPPPLPPLQEKRPASTSQPARRRLRSLPPGSCAREFAIMQSPSKLCAATGSTQPAESGLQGWADLPDGLLDSILALSGSFRDLLAFAATSRSWRAAFSSYPSKSAFCAKFPPLLVQFHVLVQPPDIPSNSGHHELRTCKVIDPTNKNITLPCQIPQDIYGGRCVLLALPMVN